MTKETKNKLKAFFAAQSMDVVEEDSPNNWTYDSPNNWTYGGAEGMSIEKIMETIDAFDEEKIT